MEQFDSAYETLFGVLDLEQTLEDGPVYMDAGSSNIVAGMAGSMPTVRFYSYVGRPKKALNGERRAPFVMPGLAPPKQLSGTSVEINRGYMTMHRVISHGIVQNWDDFESIMHTALYNELRIAPEEHPLMITQPLFHSKGQKEKITQLIFETFNCPATSLILSPVLALHGICRTTGLIVDLGAGLVQLAPFVEGFCVNSTSAVCAYGGEDIDEYLRHQHTLRNRSSIDSLAHMTAIEQLLIYRDIKERHGYVAPSAEAASMASMEPSVPYILPDGQEEKMSESELASTGEVWFEPSRIGMECPGIHKMIARVISQCPIDVRKSLWGSIVLCGGGSKTRGLVPRLYNELRRLCPTGVSVNIIHRNSFEIVEQQVWKLLQRNKPANAIDDGGGTTYSLLDKLPDELIEYILKKLRARAVQSQPAEVSMAIAQQIEPDLLTAVGMSVLASRKEYRTRWFYKQDYDECGPPPPVRRKEF